MHYLSITSQHRPCHVAQVQQRSLSSVFVRDLKRQGRWGSTVKLDHRASGRRWFLWKDQLLDSYWLRRGKPTPWSRVSSLRAQWVRPWIQWLNLKWNHREHRIWTIWSAKHLIKKIKSYRNWDRDEIFICMKTLFEIKQQNEQALEILQSNIFMESDTIRLDHKTRMSPKEFIEI